MNLIEHARVFNEYFETEYVLSFKGRQFNQRQLIELIEKYSESKFIDGGLDSDNLFKPFMNVISFPVKIAAKMTDLDTKDFRFLAEEGQSYVPVYFYNKELKAWMKEKKFGLLLNKIVQGLPKYGNYVLKIIGDDIKPVHLRNFKNNPWVEHLADSSVVIEEHHMGIKSLMEKRGVWNVNELEGLINAVYEQGGTAKVCEIYGYAPRGFFDGSSDGELTRGVCIVSGFDDFERDNKGIIVKDNARVLFKAERELPYFELYWDEYSGRWLRLGIPEELLEEQFHINEVSNLEFKGLYWTSKHIYQTKDMMVAKNLMTDVQNGDVLRVASELTPVINEERNLSAFNVEFDRWDKNRKEKVMTFESITGETMPAATPFRLGFILQQAAAGYYDFKRENIGLFLAKLINEIIAPTFRNSKRSKHLYNLYGEDDEYAQMEELYVEYEVYKELERIINKGMALPSKESIERARQAAKERLRKRNVKVIEIPEGFYDDLKYKIDLVITNEQIALDAKMQTMVTVLQTLATNPAILQNDTTRKILYRILDFSGISPEILRVTQQPIVSTPLSPPPGQVSPELQGATQQQTL